MRFGLLPLILASLFFADVRAQGCVAIRHFSCSNAYELGGAVLGAGDVSVGMNYRYFKSFRHFRGTHEEPDRVANNTEVINHAHALDVSLIYGLSNRTYVTVALPFVLNTRSSLYEHGRTERNTTYSRGLSDMRAGIGYWFLNPVRSPRFNVAGAASLKLPTGSFNAADLFYNVGIDGRSEVRPVDQSIQPGDGGVGIAAELQLFHQILDEFSWYGYAFYLANPRETNGVRTFRETLSPLLENEAVTSVPDQFALRLGLAYSLPLQGFGATLGLRYEGVPVEDIIGGSSGFRRPGSVLSLEPSLHYSTGRTSLSLSVPIAVRRERPQSVTDLEMERITGNPRHGDAAFADYLINLGVSYRLPSARSRMEAELPQHF